ncbi:MAG: hypothetical protein ACI97B_001724 [Verrucomicrobiales bacterium]|jgi:hypothetical protein
MHKIIAFFVVLLVGCKPATPPQAAPPIDGSTAPAPAPRFHLLLEAEDLGEVTAPFEIEEQQPELVSGGKCLLVPPGLAKAKKLDGRLSFDLDLPSDEKAHFWLRVYWTGSCSNSLNMKLGDLPKILVGEDGTYKQWHWVRGPTLPLPAGTHPIVITAREDDIRVDQILVTADKRYVPMGIEE